MSWQAGALGCLFDGFGSRPVLQRLLFSAEQQAKKRAYGPMTMQASVKSISHVWEDLRDGRVVSVMEDYPIAHTGDICAVYPPGKYTPPKVSAFIDFLKSKYGKPPYWETDYRGSRASEAGKPRSV